MTKSDCGPAGARRVNPPTRFLVPAAQLLRQQMQIAVVEAERFERMHGREHIVAVRAGLAVALAHQMKLRREIEPAGILHVPAIDHVDQRGTRRCGSPSSVTERSVSR